MAAYIRYVTRFIVQTFVLSLIIVLGLSVPFAQADPVPDAYTTVIVTTDFYGSGWLAAQTGQSLSSSLADLYRTEQAAVTASLSGSPTSPPGAGFVQASVNATTVPYNAPSYNDTVYIGAAAISYFSFMVPGPSSTPPTAAPLVPITLYAGGSVALSASAPPPGMPIPGYGNISVGLTNDITGSPVTLPNASLLFNWARLLSTNPTYPSSFSLNDTLWITPNTPYTIESYAQAVVGMSGYTWSWTAGVTSTVDPYVTFDQSAFDVAYRGATYPLSDYFQIEFSPNLPLTPSAVPEPATMLLLGSGLIGLWGFKKKFKN